ncbi:RHS repeat-associated core domain-containing protein, partial [Pseudomonas sp. IT-P100]|uniref:RHS repeat-associated core domain-containing protein n=1 Tax=Pseudomonas sp. IT-P100 TaxID=3026452 RepID=UPI0039E0A628
LYYYGYRYYAPWLQRWICPDPAGDMDGLNRYAMVRNNPVNFYDWQGTLSIPADIFIADIVNPMNKSIGTGWFEELRWNQEKNTFMSTGPVYGRDMKAIEGGNSEWYPSSFGNAIAAFRDQDGKLRLFANMYQQHMGIQPGMGLPEFAGLLKVDEQDPSKLVINNHSGHYKPESSIDVTAMILEIAPQQQSVSYAPIPESSSFDSALRIHSIDSPEMYERLVNTYKRDFNGLITYLKEQGVWEAAKTNWEEREDLNIIFKMETKGMTAQQIRYEESTLRNAKPLADPVRPSIGTRRVTRPLAQEKIKKTSFFRSLGHRFVKLYEK